MLSVIFLAATLIGFALHLTLSKQSRTKNKVVEFLLIYLLAVNIGVGGILAWYGHTRSWQMKSPAK